MHEFDLIERIAERAGSGGGAAGVVLGPGDDAAVLEPETGKQLVATTDTLVEGVHFAPAAAPEAIGHKALAVNLSDLAAMGATPRWLLLSLVLPDGDANWLDGFLDGFLPLAARHGAQLAGGDTTSGPRCITVQALGTVPAGEALRRGGARPGQRVVVSGTLGGAGLALELRRSGRDVPQELALRLDRPEPRVALGTWLRGRAGACIDLSDGLLADLGHVLTASAVGARIELDRLPLAPGLEGLEATRRWALAGAAGDDYELCFTVSAETAGELARWEEALALPLCEIGKIEAEPGLRCIAPDGSEWTPPRRGYRHFEGNA